MSGCTHRFDPRAMGGRSSLARLESSDFVVYKVIVMCRILLLTGMTPDRRIFDRVLPLLSNAEVVEWIPPGAHEPIAAYANRLSCNFDPHLSTVVCGVSFGGIIARELACRLNARSCVLVSSVGSPQEMPPWYRLCRNLSPATTAWFLRAIGCIATYWPGMLKTPSICRAAKLAGRSGQWYRWATAAVLTWKPSVGIDRVPLIKIHGDRDTTFPIRYINSDLVIDGGGHLLPLTHYQEIAAALRRISG